MTPAQLKKHLELLTELRAQLLGKGPAKIAPNRTDQTKVGGDEDEQPLNEMLQTIASHRNKNDAALVLRIDKALRKLRDDPGEYGLCEDCGDDLPAPRLKAMPYAELCLECQSKRDGPKGPKTRRNLYDFR
ncbi:MAG TPA: TraR/DksA family transcriptional regulator [Myxococcales bacterium]|jgi:DnaK suppressor protein